MRIHSCPHVILKNIYGLFSVWIYVSSVSFFNCKLYSTLIKKNTNEHYPIIYARASRIYAGATNYFYDKTAHLIENFT